MFNLEDEAQRNRRDGLCEQTICRPGQVECIPDQSISVLGHTDCTFVGGKLHIILIAWCRRLSRFLVSDQRGCPLFTIDFRSLDESGIHFGLLLPFCRIEENPVEPEVSVDQIQDGDLSGTYMYYQCCQVLVLWSHQSYLLCRRWSILDTDRMHEPNSMLRNRACFLHVCDLPYFWKR